MPKERNSSHRDKDRETRSHRSSSHRREPGREAESQEHNRRHTRNRRQRRRPYHRETEPHSSTHIYFNGSDNVPSVSLHTDHVTLAANLTSLWEQREGSLFANCFEMMGRLRSNRPAHSAVQAGNLQQGTTARGQRARGVNHYNLATVPISVQKKSESWSGILETYKTASLVPAANTKARLLQSLVSHTEAKLDSIDISLLCPLTRSRMATPVRGRSCTHIHCFDGEAYLQLMWEKHVEKWKCPICKCLAPLSELVVDGFIMGILEAVPEDVKSVEFTPDGSWRKKKDPGSLSSINTSSVDCNSDQGNNVVIDLTFDTPDKVVQKKLSDADGNFGRDVRPLMIDLTESP